MNIKGAMPFWKNAACHVTAQKSTFFSSQKNWGKFCFWADDSYVEKSEKNIGAKIFTLSIAVFPEFAIQVLIFSYISLLTQLPPFETLIANSGKTAIDRVKIFSPIFCSDFSS